MSPSAISTFGHETTGSALELSDFVHDWVLNVESMAPDFRRIFEELKTKEREYEDVIAQIERCDEALQVASDDEAKNLEVGMHEDLKKAEALSKEKEKLANEGLQRLTQHIHEFDESFKLWSFDKSDVPSLEVLLGQASNATTARRKKRRSTATFDQKRKRHRLSDTSTSLSPPPIINEDHGVEEEDESETDLYCICRKPSSGTMIACDGPGCPVEWFHLRCVGLHQAPADNEQWICPVCRGEILVVDSK